jgi:hypothetical protein
LVGVAVKVTLVPAQIEFPGFAEILIEGTTIGFTVIVMLFDVAVVVLTQGALLVNTQVTICPLVKVVVVNVELLVPAFTPFTLH